MFRAFSFFLFIPFIFTACSSPDEAAGQAKTDSTAAANINPSIDDPNMDGYVPDTLRCEDLADKKVIEEFLRENDSYGFIKYDTSRLSVMYGHFISATKNSTLVLIPGDSGPPCGDGCNMVLLFTCGDSVKLIMSGMSGWFTEDDIRDLDHDGVPEIITTTEMMNMGECSNTYHILNYKDGKENILYESGGYEEFGCGFGDENISWHHKGDTVGLVLTTALIDPDSDRIFEVKEYNDYRIFNGGKTEDEVLDKAIHKYDTVVVPLKKIK